MTYDPTIPLVTASPKNSAAPIQVNFSQFNSVFSSTVANIIYNHTPFTNSLPGKHGATIFQNQTADPGVTDNLTVVYAKEAPSAVNPTPGIPELFLQIPKYLPNEQPNTPMQLTYSTVSTTVPYQSFMAGGYVVYMGSTTTAATPIVLTPAPSSILIVLADTQVLNGTVPWGVTAEVTQPATFRLHTQSGSPANMLVLWFAIGKV